MKGYWQRHLEVGAKEPELEASFLADEADLASDEVEGMSEEDIVALFGYGALPAKRRQPNGRQWKPRKPFAPKRPDIRPKPWSELSRPMGLPSFIP